MEEKQGFQKKDAGLKKLGFWHEMGWLIFL